MMKYRLLFHLYPLYQCSVLAFNCNFSIFNNILTKRRAPIPLSEEMGTSPSFQNKYFDPFQFASEDNFAILREAELKHGRIAMLAVIGQIAPDLFWENVNVGSIYLSKSHEVYFQNVDSGLGALSSVPFFGWVQIVSFVGYLENRVFVQKVQNAMPGDYVSYVKEILG